MKIHEEHKVVNNDTYRTRKSDTTNITMKSLIILLCILIVIAALYFLNFDNQKRRPIMIVTSDTHISSPQGRWKHFNLLYSNFIEKIKKSPHKPEIIFVVGDVVDNVLNSGSGVIGGPVSNWQIEVNLYKKFQKQLPDVKFLTALGAGHDYGFYVSRNHSEKHLEKSKGTYDWNGIRLIWFDINIASFPEPHEKNVLTPEELNWVKEKIETADNKVILLNHVPYRTDETFSAGVWANETNLTIPTNDSLYKIIKQFNNKIVAIFNGHIHKSIQSQLFGIPLYISPLVADGSYCSVTQLKDGEILVKQRKITE